MYTMQDEHNLQVATEGDAGGVRGGEGVAAFVCPSLQSQEIYTTAIVRVSGIQNHDATRLSQHRRHPR